MEKFALVSVSDKTDIVEFAKRIKSKGYSILATGNTAKIIKENGIECREVSDYTSFPEVFSGRLKTLQPSIFGGILMRKDNGNDLRQADENNINPIEIVCVNLYPFPEVIKKTNTDLQTKIENIDIGGPSLIRAAAKNYKYVSILTNPSQYKEFLEMLEEDKLTEDFRRDLAYKAFSHTAFYDTVIANFFEEEFELPKEQIRINYEIAKSLRYGENPHQKAYLFGDFFEHFEILHGKEISYNNIIDLNAAVELVYELQKKSCAIIKHTNPAGAATADTVLEAYSKALSGDPVASFGGIVAFNDVCDEKTAVKLNKIFLEIIAAPDFTEEALEILKKKKNRRLVKIINYKDEISLQVKSITGGLIAQEKDNSFLNDEELETVTEAKCSAEELKELKFAWVLCKHTKSNAIVYTKNKTLLAAGAGQMSRVDSARFAVLKAKEHGHNLSGAVAASDAFFPFADGLEEIASAGITSVIQPGGSVRDNEVIDAANKNNMKMIFTKIRNFKH